MDSQSDLNMDAKAQSEERAGDSGTAEHLRIVTAALDVSASNIRKLAGQLVDTSDRMQMHRERIQELEQELASTNSRAYRAEQDRARLDARVVELEECLRDTFVSNGIRKLRRIRGKSMTLRRTRWWMSW